MYCNLTRRQQQIYDFLVEHYDTYSNTPTLEEVCQALGMTSRGSMHKHIQALVEAGLVEPAHRKQRGIRLTRSDPLGDNSVPLVGSIAAGKPIEAIETPETINVPDQLTGKGPCYVLQVKGDSMIEDGILDGDWVVIEQRSHAHNGEIVVALIEGRDATLKHIEQRPGQLILHPANSSMNPIQLKPEQVEIQGVVIGQMRSYK